jgi:hypothetical protein
VIDAESDTIGTISLPSQVSPGGMKWSGISAVGAKLYAAPLQSGSVLVIDTPDIADVEILTPGVEILTPDKFIVGSVAEAGVLSERDPVCEVVLNAPLRAESLEGDSGDDDAAAANVQISLSLVEDEQGQGSEGSAWCDGGRCVVCVDGSGSIDLSSDCLSLRVGDTVRVACQDPLHVFGALGTIVSIARGETAIVKLKQCRHHVAWGECSECVPIGHQKVQSSDKPVGAPAPGPFGAAAPAAFGGTGAGVSGLCVCVCVHACVRACILAPPGPDHGMHHVVCSMQLWGVCACPPARAPERVMWVQ